MPIKTYAKRFMLTPFMSAKDFRMFKSGRMDKLNVLTTTDYFMPVKINRT